MFGFKNSYSQSCAGVNTGIGIALDASFPLPLYSELHGCIASLKWFVQGSSNVHVCAISMHPPTHPVAYPGEIKYCQHLVMIVPLLTIQSVFQPDLQDFY